MKNLRNVNINSIIEYLNPYESYEIFKKISNKKLYSKVFPLLKKNEEPKYFSEEEKKVFPFCLLGSIRSLSKGIMIPIACSFLIQPDLVVSYLSQEEIVNIDNLDFFHKNISYKILYVAKGKNEKIVLMKIEANIIDIDFQEIEKDFLGKNKYKILENMGYLYLNVFMININYQNDFKNYFQKFELYIKNNLSERTNELDLYSIDNYLSGSPIFIKIRERYLIYGIFVHSNNHLEKSNCLRFFDCRISKFYPRNMENDLFSIYLDYFSSNSFEIENVNSNKMFTYNFSNFSFSDIEIINLKKIISKNELNYIFPQKCYYNIKCILLIDSHIDDIFLKHLSLFLKDYSKSLDHLIISGNCIEGDSKNLIDYPLINLSTNKIKQFKFANNYIDSNYLINISAFIEKMIIVENIDLSKNNIDDKSIQIIALSLKKLNNLKSLILADNNIDDHGSEFLSLNVKISFLDLSNNHISLNGETNVVKNLPKSTKILFSGKSFYGMKGENIISIPKNNKNKDKNCCLIN